MNNERKSNRKRGRPIEKDPARNCVMVRFTDAEYAKFLSMYEKSGAYAKAIFIKARVFNEEFRVVEIDHAKMKFINKLSTMHAQFRYVGVNYNQVVKLLNTHFSEKKALSSLFKLEQLTIELVKVSQRIVDLCHEMKQHDSKD